MGPGPISNVKMKLYGPRKKKTIENLNKKFDNFAAKHKNNKLGIFTENFCPNLLSENKILSYIVCIEIQSK